MKEIIAFLQSGIVTDVANLPKGYTLIVNDYDCEGMDDILQDQDGGNYIRYEVV